MQQVLRKVRRGFFAMSRSIVIRANSARNLASSICSGVTGLSPAPVSLPASLRRTQLLTFAFGTPSTFAVTAADCPPLTSLTVSSLNSSVYFPRTCFVVISSFLANDLTIS